MLTLAKTLSYYKRRDIQEELVRQARDKEVAFRFEDFFGKRPEILTYPDDILEVAKQKVTSLHCSEELWANPMQLTTGLKKEDMDKLRKGWDLLLDIDCHFFEYSRIAAYFTIKALQDNGVKSITAKFSGSKGFHIAVPFEAFPETFAGKNTSDLFPEAPRRIAAYITGLIRGPLADEILKFEKSSFANIIKRTGLKESEIIRYEKNEFGDKIPKINIDSFLEIDTILISSRHMYRMPYSFHEKSELISVPVDINKIMAFEKDHARPELVVIKHPFLDRKGVAGDAALLLRNAYDFEPQNTSWFVDEEKTGPGGKGGRRGEEYTIPEKAIGEEFFPPCIKLIFNGIEDGKKRAVFVLINFLSSCGWEPDMVEKKILEWNEKNREPLRPVYILGQTRYAKQQGKRNLPPPNCNNPNYYLGIGVCKPDEFCPRIKNPLQYAKKKSELAERYAPRQKKAKAAGSAAGKKEGVTDPSGQKEPGSQPDNSSQGQDFGKTQPL
jgi:hypothetical protein